MYHDGWFARTIHKAPWEPKPRRPLAEDIWELYDTRTDFSLVNDLAAENPEKLAELQALFMERGREEPRAADRRPHRSSGSMPALAGRPDLMAGRTSLTLAEGMTGMTENVFLNIKNKSKTITAEIEVPEGGAQRRDPRAGRPLRRLGAVRQGRRACLRLQLPRVCSASPSPPPSRSLPARRRSASSSPTTAADWARAAPARSS